MNEEVIGAICSTAKAHEVQLGKSEGIRSLRIPGAGEKIILKRYSLDLMFIGLCIILIFE
jgi:hypothetical protein